MNVKVFGLLAAIHLGLMATLGATSSQASVFSLNLSGNVEDITRYSIYIGLPGLVELNVFDLQLHPDYFDTPFELTQGDELVENIRLDSAYTFSNPLELFYEEISGTSAFPEGGSVSGNFNFYQGSTLVGTLVYSTTSVTPSGYAIIYARAAAPSSFEITFDSFTNDMTFDSLATPMTIRWPSPHRLDWREISDVPEPGTWAFMIVGLGLAGAALRCRRKALAA
jgi:hypothetical protein